MPTRDGKGVIQRANTATARGQDGGRLASGMACSTLAKMTISKPKRPHVSGVPRRQLIPDTSHIHTQSSYKQV